MQKNFFQGYVVVDTRLLWNLLILWFHEISCLSSPQKDIVDIWKLKLIDFVIKPCTIYLEYIFVDTCYAWTSGYAYPWSLLTCVPHDIEWFPTDASSCSLCWWMLIYAAKLILLRKLHEKFTITLCSNFSILYSVKYKV